MEEQITELFRIVREMNQQMNLTNDRLESLSNSLKGFNQLLKQLQMQVDKIKK